jgi:putative ABC transport system permease protein
MWHPITQAFRQLKRNRWHSLTIVAIMALCIGSCVAIFSMVRAVLLEDWGYANPDRLAILWHARPNAAGVVGVGPSDYLSYRSSLGTVDAVGAVTTRGFNLGGEPPARVTCARITGDMFPLLGVRPSRGRWFSADDDRPGARVAVINERLWRRWGGEGDPLDRDILLDGVQYRIVGVMPAAFVFPPEGIQSLTAAECWLPAGFTPAELAIPSFSYVLFARLKDGVSLEQAGADAHAGAQRIWSTYPAALQNQVQLTARMIPLADQALSRSRTPLALFATAVLGLLLIGCANVSNLTLTGLESRHIELSVRASLGATRGALVMQVLCESIALAVIGGLAGVLLASGLLSALIATNVSAFPRLGDARIDTAAVVFAIAVGIIAGGVGAVPALLRSRPRSAHGIRVAARGFGLGLRGVLIGIEIALAVAVLVVAGVLSRSVAGLHAIDPGFDPNEMVTLSVALPEAGHPSIESILAFSDEVQRRLGEIRGVSAAAAASGPPIGEAAPGVVFAAASASPDYKPALVHVVSPEYLRAAGLTIHEGRFLDSTDTVPGATSAVVNQTLAAALFPDGAAVGRSFHRIGSTRQHTVIGVVADVRQAGPQRPAPPALYLAFAQAEQAVRTMSFVVRGRAPMSALAPQIRQAVAAVNAALPPFALRSGRDLLNSTIAIQRFNMLVVTLFAIFALTLALCGVCAVLTHAVQQTRRETGIRMALGATGARIIRTTSARVLIPAIAGIGVGIAGAATASELVASLVFAVKPNDPATLAISAAAALAASIVAVLIPASKAARVDLVTLLRHE